MVSVSINLNMPKCLNLCVHLFAIKNMTVVMCTYYYWTSVVVKVDLGLHLLLTQPLESKPHERNSVSAT